MSNKIKKIYENKIFQYQKHSKLYFDKNSPLISDDEFDKLKKEILILEKKEHMSVAEP